MKRCHISEAYTILNNRQGISDQAAVISGGGGASTAVDAVEDNEMDRIWAARKKIEDNGDMDASNESLANAVESMLKTAQKGYIVTAARESTGSVSSKAEEAMGGELADREIIEADTHSVENEKREGVEHQQESPLPSNVFRPEEVSQLKDDSPTGNPEIAAYRFLQPTSAIARQNIQNNDEEANTLLRNDVNNVLNDIDKATDYTLLCMVNLCVILSFSEILKQKDVYTKNIMNGHKISADFISSTLKSVYDVLGKQLPEVSFI
jgi:hypothetical protein